MTLCHALVQRCEAGGGDHRSSARLHVKWKLDERANCHMLYAESLSNGGVYQVSLVLLPVHNTRRVDRLLEQSTLTLV